MRTVVQFLTLIEVDEILLFEFIYYKNGQHEKTWNNHKEFCKSLE